MKYVRFQIIPEDGGFHPVDRRLSESPNVTKEAIHQINLVTDETASVLYELGGSLEGTEELFAEIETHPDILTLDVTETDGRLFGYAHFRANEAIRTLVRTGNELVVELPLECLSNGGLRMTAIGQEEVIYEVRPDVPEGVDIHVEGIGEYRPRSDRMWAKLTPRQRDTLVTAVDLGYYRSPRTATTGDIAARLDVSDATVCEHLQKAEQRVMEELVPH